MAAHRRKVWHCVERYLEADQVDVCVGIIYPAAPETPGLREVIEDYLGGYGIQVVWYEERRRPPNKS